MTAISAHADTFAADHLPSPDQWPDLDWSGLPELAAYPDRMNCAAELLDRQAARFAERPVLRFGDQVWTYGDLLDKVNRIARILVEDFGILPGNRVMLRGPNNPMNVACWFAIMKTGAVAVATMPMLRWRELTYMADKARVTVALCEARLAPDLETAMDKLPHLKRAIYFNGEGGAESLEARMATKSPDFDAVDTAADDVCLIAFTSGTTGQPKGCMHFHRDILSMCTTFSDHVLKPVPEDIFAGSPPIAFTFGLGALVVFPMSVGASTVLVEQFTPESMLETIERYRVTTFFTAPTAFRAMTPFINDRDISSLRACVSAGETLPLATWQGWFKATGLKIIDGLGSTELLHIFIAAAGDDIRPGATGKPVPGYQAKVVDEAGATVVPGTIGRLAVKGPTGCRYLDDAERQKIYVEDGWNFTGDAYLMDEDGYFWFQARADDMIISAGYNISGPEVEAVLLEHPKVAEAAVVAAPDEQRGFIVKAFVVLRDAGPGNPETASELQSFVKSEIAPYKYPRSIEFLDELPRTPTGKVQRFVLRRQAAGQG